MTRFVDISSYNAVDWVAYSMWSDTVAIKSTEGNGFADPVFPSHRANALAASMACILYYHFSRPDLGNSPIVEANSQYRIVGKIRPQDLIVLDFEVQDSRATAEWAYQFLAQQEENYKQLPAIYASSSYILERLQDQRLARFPLWLANWTYNQAARPACPRPWTSYLGLQYTDKASIPGIAGTVDADVFLGEYFQARSKPMPQVPKDWHDDGKTLYSPDKKHPITLGFREHILNDPNWNPANWAVEDAQGVDQLEEQNAALGKGVRQGFRLTQLEWNTARGVFECWVGTEILALRAKVALLEKQLAEAKSPTK